jgi:hypothetical protein
MSDVVEDGDKLDAPRCRGYGSIQYNPVASTCTSVTLANGVVNGLGVLHVHTCIEVSTLQYIHYLTPGTGLGSGSCNREP